MIDWNLGLAIASAFMLIALIIIVVSIRERYDNKLSSNSNGQYLNSRSDLELHGRRGEE